MPVWTLGFNISLVSEPLSHILVAHSGCVIVFLKHPFSVSGLSSQGFEALCLYVCTLSAESSFLSICPTLRENTWDWYLKALYFWTLQTACMTLDGAHLQVNCTLSLSSSHQKPFEGPCHPLSLSSKCLGRPEGFCLPPTVLVEASVLSWLHGLRIKVLTSVTILGQMLPSSSPPELRFSNTWEVDWSRVWREMVHDSNFNGQLFERLGETIQWAAQWK